MENFKKAEYWEKLNVVREKLINGTSEILNKWNQIVPINYEDFMKAFEWLYEDPGDENGQPTKEIALSSSGIKKISIRRDKNGNVMRFTEDENEWTGEYLRVPYSKDFNLGFDDKEGKIGVTLMICLDKNDQI